MTTNYLTQIIICLAFLIIIFFLSKILSKKSTFNKKSNREIDILEKIHIGQKEKIVLLKVANQKLLVGVTSNNISLIKNMDDTITHENAN